MPVVPLTQILLPGPADSIEISTRTRAFLSSIGQDLYSSLPFTKVALGRIGAAIPPLTVPKNLVCVMMARLVTARLRSWTVCGRRPVTARRLCFGMDEVWQSCPVLRFAAPPPPPHHTSPRPFLVPRHVASVRTPFPSAARPIGPLPGADRSHEPLLLRTKEPVSLRELQRNLLKRSGVQAGFKDRSLVSAKGLVEVRRRDAMGAGAGTAGAASTQVVEVEGVVGPEFFKIREEVYKMFTFA